MRTTCERSETLKKARLSETVTAAVITLLVILGNSYARATQKVTSVSVLASSLSWSMEKSDGE